MFIMKQIVNNQGSKGREQHPMYIPNDNTQEYAFCRLQLVIETFGHSTKSANQSKFNKSPKGC